MAEISLASASVKQVWQKEYFQEYIRMSGYKAYMSATNNGNKTGIILTRYDQLSREAGQTINIPFIGRLNKARIKKRERQALASFRTSLRANRPSDGHIGSSLLFSEMWQVASWQMRRSTKMIDEYRWLHPLPGAATGVTLDTAEQSVHAPVIPRSVGPE